jgi:hypothetical protein
LAALGGDTSSPEPPPAAAKPAGDFRCPQPGCDFEGKNAHSLSMHTTRRHKPKKAVQSVVKPKPIPAAPPAPTPVRAEADPALLPASVHRCDDCSQRFVDRRNFESHRMHGCDSAEVAS